MKAWRALPLCFTLSFSLSFAVSCTPDQPRLAYGEAPRLSIRVVEGLTVEGLPGAIPMWSATDDAARDRVSLFVGALPGEPVTGARTLPVIAGLYGLRPLARVPADFVAPGHPLRRDFAEWTETAASEPVEARVEAEAEAEALARGATLLVTTAPSPASALQAEAALDAALYERGLSRRTVRVVVGAAAPGAAALRAGGSLLALRVVSADGSTLSGPFACAIDLLPTLLAAVGAVPPSDAQGHDLWAQPRRAEEACVQHGADGSLGAASPLGRLWAPAGASLDGGLPSEVQVWGPAGDSGEAADGASLWAALVQHEQRAQAQTAGGRVGEERLRGVLRANGYW